ncbi:MAG: restriction endonuclease subunit S [Synergistales bacterium]|nr:restriction endonuclease subunit S [Synergistales bacterium]
MSEVRNVSETLPEGYRLTELGPLPEEWQVVRLGEVLCEVDVRVKELGGSTYELPVLSLTKNDGLILQTDRFGKRIATEDVGQYKVVRRGQIVNNPYVIWEGAVHILSKYDAGLVSPVYPVWEVKKDIAFAWFVDPLLRMPAAISAYNRFASGAVNRRRAIRKSDFLSVPIPLPPLPEQRAIAHVLRTVQQAKEATERVIAALRELKKSLMRHLFTYGPVPVDQTERVPLQETDIGPIPEHWQVVRLGNFRKDGVIWVKNGFPQGKFNEEGHGVPHLRPFNVTDDGQISLEQIKYVSPPPEDSPYWLRKCDILFNNTNSEELVGKVAFVNVNGRFVLSNHMTIIRVQQPEVLDPMWVASWFLLLWQRGLTQALARRHVNQASISLARLENIPIPLPPLAEQQEIARILQAVDEKIRTEEGRKAALETLFKTLLHDLMTARRRLPTDFIARFEEESSHE